MDMGFRVISTRNPEQRADRLHAVVRLRPLEVLIDALWCRVLGDPLSSEPGIYKTDRARFRPCLSGKGLQNVGGCSLFAQTPMARRLHAVVRLRPLEVLFRRFRIGTLVVRKLRSRKFTTQNDLYE